MYLNSNPSLKHHLWSNLSAPMMARLKLELGHSLPSIFALHDIKSLLSLERPEVKARIAVAQLCMVEGMVVMGLNEIFQPLQFESTLKEPFIISIQSLFQYGMFHMIQEHPQSGFELSAIYPSNPDRIEPIHHLPDLDSVINTIAGFEQEQRETKRLRL